MENLEAVKKTVKEKGIEFFLCSFVEMSGVPKAKLVPAEHLEDMAEGSAGFGRIRRRQHGTGTTRFRHDRETRLQQPDTASLEKKCGLGGLQHLCQRRTLALLSANDPPTPAESCRRKRVPFQDRRGTGSSFFWRRNDDGTYQTY